MTDDFDAIAWLSSFAPPLTGVERAQAGRGHKFDLPVLPAHLTRGPARGRRPPAGADLSDVYNEGYGGGLCLAVVSGRRAGRSAALRTRKEAQRG